MEDRIQINGVWYVKEDTKTDEPIDNYNDIKLQIYQNHEISHEDDYLCLEATINLDYDIDSLHILVTDKRNKPWVSETWDNSSFFYGLHKRSPESIEVLDESNFTRNMKGTILKFIDKLVELKWL
jgi:hypothetical protein